MVFSTFSRRRSALAVMTVALVGSLALPTSPVSAAGPSRAATVSPAQKAAAQVRAAGVPTLTWRSCGTDFPGAQCATATVPLDYDSPQGATTTIALARYPATNTSRRIGSVFVNPGGPGASGVETVLAGGFGPFLRTQLDGRFDVVGFDPRGVAGSDPLRCFSSEAELGELYAGLPVFPVTTGQQSSYFTRTASAGARCTRADEVIDEHMSTADVARDLDLLRQAVGDSKLTYLGFSYGSFLGATYANLFPRNIRAMAIDGVLDPHLWSSGQQVRSDRVATQREFDEFLRLCDEATAGCAFYEDGGSAARWDALADALRAEPLVDGAEVVYSYDLLIADAASAMYAPETWGGPGGAAAFFDQVADVVLAGGAGMRGLTSSREALSGKLSREADYPNYFEGYYGNQCADTEYPSTLAKFRATGGYAAAGSQFGSFWWWQNTVCAKLPVNADRYAGPWATATSARVLVVGNTFDGVTDLAGAQAASSYLRGSRLLTYAGWGHTAYGRSACATDHMDAYLLSGALPAAGTVCPANPNPFGAAGRRSSERQQPMVGLPGPLVGLPGPVAGSR